MLDGRFRLAITQLVVFAGIAFGQQHAVSPQSPRLAIIEMFSGGEAAFRRHLTVEMQNKLQGMMLKNSSSSVATPWQALTAPRTDDPDKFQAFDLGPILFSFNDPDRHERNEIQIDSDTPRGDEDNMVLSLHLVRNGMEHEAPVGVRFVVNMKRQDGIWRLNAITISSTLSLGDPRMLENSWLGPALLRAIGAESDSVSVPTVLVEERPKMTPLRAVRMIAMAENIFAQNHPGIGYTCRIADLVNVGKGLDEEGVYKFMDEDFAEGVYNGYRYTLAGCDRRPARAFHVFAEPVAGKGRAYCSDNTSNLRSSDDGRGVTCLTSGKIARR